MRSWKLLALPVVATAALWTSTSSAAPSQVSVTIGAAPVCPYGYYSWSPYECAPYGYYGPDWFINGVFVGAGPWFHGPEHFYGHVDNHFDPHHGYNGPYPHHGDRPDEHHVPGHDDHFHGNEMRDGHGHEGHPH